MALICALLFNIVGASAITLASGLPFAGVFGGGALISLFGGAGAGQTNMAIQKEIWMSSIVEGLFADNSFLSKARKADEFVNMGRIVHIPNAGAPSNVVKNRTVFPATVSTRTDIDLEFRLDEYTTDPIRIPHADKVELSYDKRESVIRADRAKLADQLAQSVLFEWSPSGSGNVIRTTGDAVISHVEGTSGNRKAFTKLSVSAAMLRFNRDDVPQTGRYLLLDADMYQQLLDSMTQKDSDAFFALADVKKGVIGQLYSFNVMMRSRSLLYNSAGSPKDWNFEIAEADNAGALAWHEDSVCRALGEVVAFENEADPTFYGDIYSFLVRAGGRPMRSDAKGLLAIIQDTAA